MPFIWRRRGKFIIMSLVRVSFLGESQVINLVRFFNCFAFMVALLCNMFSRSRVDDLVRGEKHVV